MAKSLDKTLILIIIIAVALRLPLLNGSFWLDEAAQALESIRPFSQQLDITADFQPPLLHYLVHFASYISREEWWLRTVGSLFPGIITIVFTYLIGKNFFSKKVGIVAAGLLATSSFHIFYSQELRPYSLPAMFAVISWYLVFKSSSHKEKDKTNSKLNLSLIFFTLTSIAGLYSSYLYPFVLAAQLGYLLFIKPSFWRQWIATATVSAVTFLPWLPMFKAQLTTGQSWRAEFPGWEQVVSYDQFKSIALTIGKFFFGVLNLDINAIFLIFTLLILASTASLGFVYSKNIKAKALLKSKIFGLAVWLVIPLLLAWLVSWFIPIVQPKRVLFLLPSLYLLLAELSLNVKASLTKIIGLATLVGILLINIFSTTLYYTQPDLQRENWRDLHQHIIARYPQEQTIAVFAFNEPFAPWRWYDNNTMDTVTTGKLVITDQDPVEENLKKIQDFPYVITFEYLADLSDPQRRVHSFVKSLGYVEIDTLTYPGIGQVHIWSAPTANLSLTKEFSTTLHEYADRN